MSSPLLPPPSALAALRDLARERAVEVTVRGACMAPLLADGERVAVAPARRYWPGDVVVFRAADGRMQVHRLLGFRRHAGAIACVTRGDSAPVHDPPVPLSLLLGRVVEPPRARATANDRCRAVLAFLRLAMRRLRIPLRTPA